MNFKDSTNLKQRKTIEVPVSSWAAWGAAARVSGVSRQNFIIAVCNYASKNVMERWKEQNATQEGDGQRLILSDP